jgi:hypothetical protein
MEKNRTIIVIWSWNSAGIGEDTWHVANSPNTHDQLIGRDWPARTDDDTQRLQELVQEHTRPGGDLMVFLHRHHGYHQAHVKTLLRLAPAAEDGRLQVFLFGEGSDAIYLTSNPRGLLGTAGTFSARVQAEGRVLDLTSIADIEQRTLKADHFDHVWELYQLALRRRIYELKEDLFNCLGQYLPQQSFAPGEIYAILNRAEHRELFLRLLSFVGRIRQGSTLAEEIRIFERNTNRTFTFDDCGIQVETSYGVSVAEQYALLTAYVLRHVLTKGEPVSLIELRERFMALLLRIPGLTYYS